MRWNNSRNVVNAAVIVAAAIAVMGLQACSEASGTVLLAPTASAVMPINQVFESQHSAVQDVRRIVVRDEATWERVWAELQGPATTPAPLPRVDFSTDMVLVATLGTKPTGGYKISVGPSVQAETEVVAYVQKEVPGKKCGNAQMETHPYSVVSLARSSLSVRFVETEEVKACT